MAMDGTMKTQYGTLYFRKMEAEGNTLHLQFDMDLTDPAIKKVKLHLGDINKAPEPEKEEEKEPDKDSKSDEGSGDPKE